MTAAILADFGSTFTKVSLVDLSSGRLLAQSQSPTTVDSDVMIGYRTALADVSRQAPDAEISLRRAASSAAGGLRVTAVGLVADLTAAAARQAALNAGAKVELVLSGQLRSQDVDLLRKADPDVLLFAGGIDGGQERMVLRNARMVAAAAPKCVVVACNAKVADQVADIIGREAPVVHVVGNVMPAIGSIDVEPARAAIARVFLDHVIVGKGLSASSEFTEAVAMPTPQAVLEAARLLSAGHGTDPGLGDVVVVDVGGATTDVHSAVLGDGHNPGFEDPLLPTLPVLRSVQGDLGLRWTAAGTLEADREWLVEQVHGGHGESLRHEVTKRVEDPSFVPVDAADERLDMLLATACVFHALTRHAGQLHVIMRPNSAPVFRTDGPDLRRAGTIIGTGGVLVRRRDGLESLSAALRRPRSRSLLPERATAAIDHHYILATAGLLADAEPDAALRLIRASINEPNGGNHETDD